MGAGEEYDMVLDVLANGLSCSLFSSEPFDQA